MNNGLKKRAIDLQHSRYRDDAMLSLFKGLAGISKVPVSFFVALSSGFGYLIAPAAEPVRGVLVVIGVFLLSCSAGGWNSIQEKELDEHFERTRKRPLVVGMISVQTAQFFSFGCGLSGGLILFLGAGLVPLAVGLSSLLLYNLVYTPLKTVSELALIPGSIAGALPPYIGWYGAKGDPYDPLIWGVMVLFFLWQLPHFCLILLRYRDEYRQKDIFKNLATRCSSNSLKRIITVWLLSLCCIVLFFTVVPDFMPFSFKIILVAITPVFMFVFLYQLVMKENTSFMRLFFLLNGFFFGTLILLVMAVV